MRAMRVALERTHLLSVRRYTAARMACTSALLLPYLVAMPVATVRVATLSH